MQLFPYIEKSAIYFCFASLPSHILPLVVYPSSQEHSNEPLRLVQIWAHGDGVSIHSFTSAAKINKSIITVCLINDAAYYMDIVILIV